jgi:hypothetical protein
MTVLYTILQPHTFGVRYKRVEELSVSNTRNSGGSLETKVSADIKGREETLMKQG